MQKNILFFLLSVTLLSISFADARFLVSGLPVYLPELLIILASLAFIWHHWSTDTFSIRKIPLGIFFGVVLLLFGLMLSFLVNPFSFTGLGIIKSWFVFPMLFGWLLYQSVRSKENFLPLLLAWFASFCIVTLMALLFALQGDLTYDHRLKAFYASPNYLALFLFPGVFLGWYLSVISSPARLRTFFILFTAFISLALWLTFSYTAVASIVFGVCVIAFSRFSLQKDSSWFQSLLKPVSFGVLIVAFFLVSQYPTQKFQTLTHLSERSSLASRVMIWKSSLKILRDHPFAGIGPGQFQKTYLDYQQYFPPYLEWAVPQPHNLYLAFWLQSGIVGLLGFLLIMFFLLRHLWQVRREKDQKKALFAQMLLGIISAFLFYGIFDTPYWKNDLAYTFWLMTALTLSLKTASKV